jgi:predicted dehydrogenase
MAKLHAAAFALLPDVEISKCASRSLEKARTFAAENNIAEGVTQDQLFANPGVDALIIVVPALHMGEVSLRAAETGLPLFMEKPVGLDYEETAAAAAAVKQPHMVGLNRRFYEVLQAGKRIMDEAGGTRFVEIHMPEDIRAVEHLYKGKALSNWQYGNSVHLIDLFRFFGGEAVSARSNTSVRDSWDRSYCGVVDFASGARGVFNAQWYAPGPWRVSVYARDVAIYFAPIERGMVMRAPGRQTSELLPEGADKTLKAGFHGQAEAFAALLRTGNLSAGAASLSDYLKSVELIRALTAED